jgi:ubiquinone/menaquinone biosynthesis C-methylase UbiE
MKSRTLKYRINWKEAWKAMRDERMITPRIAFDTNFFIKFADGFSRRAKFNNYEFGRKSIKILNEILNDDLEILEIGSGPGTVTIPLAKKVKNILSIEFNKTNIKYLKENLKENNLKNVIICNQNWNKINDEEIKEKFDLVFCSHFLWQIEDLENLLKRMEKASKKYCAFMQPCGRDEIVKDIFEKITGQKYTGQFEPDADYFVYLILREWGRLVHHRYFKYTLEMNLEEYLTYTMSFVGKFIKIDDVIKEKIKGYLLEKAVNDKFIKRSDAIVMWWTKA